MTLPGCKRFVRSAWRIIRWAIRSLIDPPAEKNSTLATGVYDTEGGGLDMSVTAEKYVQGGGARTDVALYALRPSQSSERDQGRVSDCILSGIEHAVPVECSVHRVLLVCCDVVYYDIDLGCCIDDVV